MLQKWMSDLSKELGLESKLREETPGIFLIPFDDETLTIKELDEGYEISGVVCPLPQSDLEEVFKHLMFGNLFGQGTYGAILALDTENNQVIARYIEPYSTDYIDFKEHLEDLVNCIDFWKDEIFNYLK